MPVEDELLLLLVGPNLFEEEEDDDVEDFRELYSRWSEYCCPDWDCD